MAFVYQFLSVIQGMYATVLYTRYGCRYGRVVSTSITRWSLALKARTSIWWMDSLNVFVGSDLISCRYLKLFEKLCALRRHPKSLANSLCQGSTEASPDIHRNTLICGFWETKRNFLATLVSYTKTSLPGSYHRFNGVTIPLRLYRTTRCCRFYQQLHDQQPPTALMAFHNSHTGSSRSSTAKFKNYSTCPAAVRSREGRLPCGLGYVKIASETDELEWCMRRLKSEFACKKLDCVSHFYLPDLAGYSGGIDHVIYLKTLLLLEVDLVVHRSSSKPSLTLSGSNTSKSMGGCVLYQFLV